MDEPDDEHEDRYTRRARRNAIHAAASELAVRLAAVREEHFVQVSLPDEVGDLLRRARGMKASGARKRLIQRSARLLMAAELEPIEVALTGAAEGAQHDVERLHAIESWRERMLTEGDDALNAFLEAHPDADRQRLRQLTRQALRDRERGKSPAASRALFKLIRQSLTEPGD